MAEDVEIDTDEGAVEDADETGEKKSFLKSKLFMIIIGTILLLGLAGGGYFFFLSEEEIEANDIAESEENIKPMAEQMGFEEPMSEIADAVMDSNNEEATSTQTEQASPTEFTEIQQENSRMKEQVNALEAKLDQMEKAMQNQNSVQNNSPVLSSTNPNNIDYQQDMTDYSSIRQPNLTPPPKPSWGEFERINNK